MKIAYFENGRGHDLSIRQSCENIEGIPISKALITNLLKYDLIIIPSYSNQDIMSKLTKSLRTFVHFGGILVILGAVEDKTRWLPYCKHNGRFLESINFRNAKSPEMRDIIGSLDRDALRFHDQFMTHGYLSCEHRYHTSFIVGENDDKKVVMGLIEPPSGGGKLLITTLDPDYHGACGYARDRQEVNENARKLFNNIMNWAKAKTEQVNRFVRLGKWLMHFPLFRLLSLLKYASLIACTILIILFFYSKINKEVFTFWAGASSICALVLTVTFGVIRKE